MSSDPGATVHPLRVSWPSESPREEVVWVGLASGQALTREGVVDELHPGPLAARAAGCPVAELDVVRAAAA